MAASDTAYERVARLLAASSDGAGDDDMGDADADALVSTTLWASLAVFFCLYALLLWLVPDKRDKSFKSRLIMYKHNSVIGFVLDIVDAIYSLASCVLFVWDTYLAPHAPIWMFALEVHFSVFFAFNYFLQFYCAPKPMRFLVTMQAIVDKVTVVPVFIQVATKAYTGASTSFLRFSRVMKITRIFRLMRLFRSINVLVSPIDDAINSQATTLVSTLLSLIIISTGFVQFIANGEGADKWVSTAAPGDLVTFHDALYFTVITFTTVGYGDISPQTAVGRLVMVVLVVTFAYLVPTETGKLTHLLSLRSKFAGNYKARATIPHIVVACDASPAGMSAIRQFLEEFFHEDHGMDTTRVCLMVPAEPDQEWKALLLQYSTKDKLRFLKGDLTHKNDLLRARFDQASACFILADRYADDTDKMDGTTFLRALAVQRHCPGLATYVELIEPENKKHLLAIGIPKSRIVCTKEVAMGLMAQSGLWPGFSALASNLVQSSNVESDKFVAEWHQQYCPGLGKEIYRIDVGSCFAGVSFTAAAAKLYREFGVVMFAIGVGEEVALNPGAAHTISAGDVGFILAEDSKISEEIYVHYCEGGKRTKAQKLHSFGKTLSAEAMAGLRGMSTRKLADAPVAPAADDGGGAGGRYAVEIEAPAPTVALDRGGTVEETGGGDRSSSFTAIPRGRKRSVVAGFGEEAVKVRDDDDMPVRRASFTGAHPDLMSAAQEFVSDRKCDGLKGHWIIIAQTLDDLEHIVYRLRRPILRYRKIVILCPLHEWATEADETSWRRISWLKDVYVVRGTLKSEEDLVHSNVLRAHGVLVVSGKSEADSDPSHIDSETLLTTVNVMSKIRAHDVDAKRIRMVIELENCDHVDHFCTIQLRFHHDLLPSLTVKPSMHEMVTEMHHPELNQCYAAGDVTLSSFPGLLLTQAFFNPPITMVMSELLSGECVTKEESDDGLARSCIVQIPIPEAFWQEGGPVPAGLDDASSDIGTAAGTFGGLFQHLIQLDVLPLAVYRTSRRGGRHLGAEAKVDIQADTDESGSYGERRLRQQRDEREGLPAAKPRQRRGTVLAIEKRALDDSPKVGVETVKFVITNPEPTMPMKRTDLVFCLVSCKERYAAMRGEDPSAEFDAHVPSASEIGKGVAHVHSSKLDHVEDEVRVLDGKLDAMAQKLDRLLLAMGSKA